MESNEFDFTDPFISQDLVGVRQMGDHLGVIHLGRLYEIAHLTRSSQRTQRGLQIDEMQPLGGLGH